jgi:hypothetical protein
MGFERKLEALRSLKPRQAELVCPRHPGPDGSPGSATFCLETDEGRHDRSHVISRSHAIEARCGPRVAGVEDEFASRAFGAELDFTYWQYRHEHHPYHIDYIFVPRTWLKGMVSFDIGKFEDWCRTGLSDHAPLIAEFR